MNHPEASLQKTVAQYLDLVLDKSVVWSCIPSGGGGKTRGEQLKTMGLKKGLPDIMIFWKVPSDYPRELWIELKAAKGKQSTEQKDFQRRVEACCHEYRICRSLDDVIEALIQCGVPCRAKR